MRILNMAILHLKRMLKDKSVIIMMLLMPTIVVSAVAYLSRGSSSNKEVSIEISVINSDIGYAGNEFLSELGKDKSFKIKKSTLEIAKKDISENKISAAVVISEDFSKLLDKGETPKIEILKHSDSNVDKAISGKINNYIAKRLLAGKTMEVIKNSGVGIDGGIDGINASLKEERVSSSLEEVKKEGSRSLSGEITPSFIVNFLLYSMIYLVNEICSLRDNKTLRRSLSTPNKNSSVLGAVFLSMFILCVIQVSILVSITKFVFKIYWGSSILAIVLIFTALLLVTLSLGILISRWVKNQAQSAAIVNAIVTPTCMVSGSFLPLEHLPKVFGKIAYFTPQNWAITALNDVALKDYGVIEVLPNIGILLLFALAFFTAGAHSLQELVRD